MKGGGGLKKKQQNKNKDDASVTYSPKNSMLEAFSVQCLKLGQENESVFLIFL